MDRKAVIAIMAKLLNSMEDSSEFPRAGNVPCSLLFPCMVPDPGSDVNTIYRLYQPESTILLQMMMPRSLGIKKGKKVKRKKFLYQNQSREDIYFASVENWTSFQWRVSSKETRYYGYFRFNLYSKHLGFLFYVYLCIHLFHKFLNPIFINDNLQNYQDR